MTRGTKSVLWGVHAFWYHPISVGLAWRRLYQCWPSRWEWLAIFLHDFPGYWGVREMDGPDGKLHPARSARWGKRIADFCSKESAHGRYVEHLILGHSRSFCAITGHKLSILCDADKLSVLYDPAVLYWLRGVASGEIFEYRDREEIRRGLKMTLWGWLKSYKKSIRARYAARL